MSLLVEGMSQGAEALLTCCIPDFNCGGLAAARRVVGLRNVVKSKGGHMRFLELLFVIHFQERCLTDSSVSQNNQTDLLC